MSRYLKQTCGHENAVAGAVIAMQSFGDFLGFNSHLHVIATDGCFYGNGSFKICPKPQARDLEELFCYEVFKMLKAERKINDNEEGLASGSERKPGALYYSSPLLGMGVLGGF